MTTTRQPPVKPGKRKSLGKVRRSRRPPSEGSSPHGSTRGVGCAKLRRAAAPLSVSVSRFIFMPLKLTLALTLPLTGGGGQQTVTRSNKSIPLLDRQPIPPSPSYSMRALLINICLSSSFPTNVVSLIPPASALHRGSYHTLQGSGNIAIL